MVFFGGFLWVFAVSRVIPCLWRGVFGGNCGIFLGFWRVFVRIMTRGVFGCFGMWGNVSFALVSALCTLVQILVFGGQKSTSRGCFLVAYSASAILSLGAGVSKDGFYCFTGAWCSRLHHYVLQACVSSIFCGIVIR